MNYHIFQSYLNQIFNPKISLFKLFRKLTTQSTKNFVKYNILQCRWIKIFKWKINILVKKFGAFKILKKFWAFPKI